MQLVPCISQRVYCIFFTLSSSGCIRCLWNLLSKNPGHEQAIETLEPLANSCKVPSDETDSVATTLLSDYCGGLNNDTTPVATTIECHSVNRPNTPLGQKSGEISPVFSGGKGVNHGNHINGGDNRQVTQSVEPKKEQSSVPVSAPLRWAIIVKESVNASIEDVAAILENVKKELDQLSSEVEALNIDQRLEGVATRAIEKAKFAQEECDDLEKIVIDGNITPEKLAERVTYTASNIQDLRTKIDFEKKYLQFFKRFLEVIIDEKLSVKKSLSSLAMDASKAVEIAREAVEASAFVMQYVTARSEIVNLKEEGVDALVV